MEVLRCRDIGPDRGTPFAGFDAVAGIAGRGVVIDGSIHMAAVGTEGGIGPVAGIAFDVGAAGGDVFAVGTTADRRGRVTGIAGAAGGYIPVSAIEVALAIGVTVKGTGTGGGGIGAAADGRSNSRIKVYIDLLIDVGALGRIAGVFGDVAGQRGHGGIIGGGVDVADVTGIALVEVLVMGLGVLPARRQIHGRRVVTMASGALRTSTDQLPFAIFPAGVGRITGIRSLDEGPAPRRLRRAVASAAPAVGVAVDIVTGLATGAIVGRGRLAVDRGARIELEVFVGPHYRRCAGIMTGAHAVAGRAGDLAIPHAVVGGEPDRLIR